MGAKRENLFLYLWSPFFCVYEKRVRNRSVKVAECRLRYIHVQQATCACVSGSFARLPKHIVAEFWKRQHVSAEPSYQKEGVGNDGNSEACYEGHGIVLFSWSRARK